MRYLVFIILFIWLQGCKDQLQHQAHESDVYYTCSMDPQIVEPKPGKCPICKMPLTPVKKSNAPKMDELQLSDQQIQLGNITVDTVRSGSIGSQTVLTATLNYDQTRTFSISSRVMGRIERLYFKNTGEYVRKGDKLFEIYSEELNNAKQEYLLALERQKVLAGNSAIDFAALIQSARSKLRLWGMSDVQIGQLAASGKAPFTTTFYSTESGFITALDVSEGDYVMEGGTVIQLADLSKLWAEAQVYATQTEGLHHNALATVQVPGFSDENIQGKVMLVHPELAPGSRVNLLHVSIPNPGNRYKPGMPAYVYLNRPRYSALALPVDAVIRGSKGDMVWVKTGPNTFKNKMVALGEEHDGIVEIRSGLEAGEQVVITGAYLVQSEYTFKKGANPMEGHAH
jgi:membrane fusion protein, copper/silver efflux system